MFSREVGRLNKTESSISSSDEYDVTIRVDTGMI